MKLNCVIFFAKITTAVFQNLDVFGARCGAIDLNGITISKIHELYHRRFLNPLKLTSCYLNIIKLLNPSLKAVIEQNPDAIEIAMHYNILFNTGGINLPLFGIPVLIQDDFATRDKMETTSGSYELIGKKPNTDASFVKKLRDAGAIILGKTNLSEMSGFGLKVQGYSSRGGYVLNPFNSSNPVYGASSGAAVALATSMATVVFANSMLGSISGPASAMGVIGFNPTKGFIQTDGLLSFSKSTDNIGFMAKSMEDIMLLVNIFSKKSSFKKIDDVDFYSRGLKVGIIDSPYFSHLSAKEQKTNFHSVFSQLVNNGVNTINFAIKLEEGDLEKVFNGVYFEFETGMNQYLSQNITDYRPYRYFFNVRTIISKYEKNPTPRFFPEKLLYFIKLSEVEKQRCYREYINLKENFKENFENAMKANELDIVILPSQSETHGGILASLLGVPMISMPVGANSAGRFGLSFITRRENDGQLLEMAISLEKSLRKLFRQASPNYLI